MWSSGSGEDSSYAEWIKGTSAFISAMQIQGAGVDAFVIFFHRTRFTWSMQSFLFQMPKLAQQLSSCSKGEIF